MSLKGVNRCAFFIMFMDTTVLKAVFLAQYFLLTVLIYDVEEHGGGERWRQSIIVFTQWIQSKERIPNG